MKTIKVNNPRWFALYMTPHVERYAKRVEIPGITYESLVTHMAQVIQFGGDMTELWVAMEDDNPVGFAMWGVMPLPFIGTCYLYHIHCWDKGKNIATQLFIDELQNFLKKHKCTLLKGDAINEAGYRLYSRIANKNKANIERLKTVPFMGRYK